MNITITSLVAAFILSFVLMPWLMKIAPKIGLVDAPDDARKLHKKPVPMVGGLTLFLSIATVVPICLYLAKDTLAFRPYDVSELTGLLIGSAVLLLVGLIDDRFQMRGRQKLFGQFVAITILIVSGFQFDELRFAGMKFDLGIYAVIAIYAWMLVSINSINLLDGADGFASTIGIIMAIALCMMSLLQGKMVDAIVILALVGAMAGFLKYNFPPAKAFLGDSGSMLIGFLLGALAIRCTFKQATLYAFFAPVALLAIPLIDTSAAIIRRRLMGRSIYTVDRGHLHHRLMKKGFSPRMTLLWVAALCCMTAGGGIMAMYFGQSEYAIVSIILVIIVMAVGKIFGVAELQLVSNKALSIGRSFVGIRNRDPHVQSSVHVQGSHNWEELWNEVCLFADDHHLNEITIDLNVPWMHESFHATRRLSGTKKDASREWYARVPLIADKRLVGRIDVLGPKDGPDHHDVLHNLVQFLPEVETLLLELEASVRSQKHQDDGKEAPEDESITVSS